MGADDELNGFDEESLLRALRAPGSASELADEQRYVAAFRASRRRRGTRAARRGGGAARRLGAGTALAVAVGVSGGGVAAAYSGGLPDPLQTFAHRVLGPVGAPPADRDPQRTAASRSPSAPASTEPPSPTPSASEPAPTPPASASSTPEPAKESKPSKDPTGRADPEPTATVSPEPSPTPTPAALPSTTPEATPSPTESPSSTPSPTEPTGAPSPSAQPPPLPAAVTIEVAGHRVDVGQSTSVSGVVTDADSSPVAGAEVALQRRGPNGWRHVATATSDESGAVTFESAPVTRTLVLRLRSSSVSSDPWVVLMRPLLAVSSESSDNGSPDSGTSVVISVSATGGQLGDRVTILARRAGRVVTVAEGLLDADGSVDLGVTQSRPRAKYVVVLQPTSVHGASRESIRVTLPDHAS